MGAGRDTLPSLSAAGEQGADLVGLLDDERAEHPLHHPLDIEAERAEIIARDGGDPPQESERGLPVGSGEKTVASTAAQNAGMRKLATSARNARVVRATRR